MSRMMAYEHLLRQILPQTLPCPRSMALDALQMIAMDFFRETGVWIENVQEMIGCCENVATPVLPKGAALVSASDVWLDDRKLDGGDYYLEGDSLVLKNAPCGEAVINMRATLRPKRTATEMPEDLLEEYGDYLVFGTIAKLKAMSGNKVEWSDPKGAALNYELYQEGITRAKSRRFRKRFGCGVQYVQTGEME